MYKTIFVLLAFITSLCFHTPGYAQADNLSLSTLMGSNKILILGESYGQDESVNFFSEKVTQYIADGQCLNVGLEIASDQQEVLDSAMVGEVSISDIQIDTVIDHDSYREMLVSFSESIKQGKCLSIYAINPPSSIPMSKDAWMEQEVVKISGERPVAILVGNKHAVKDFKTTGDGSRNLLAQRIRLRSFGVTSILQHWKPGGFCITKTVRLYDTETDKKARIYVKESIGEISAAMPEKVSMVSDGVLVWGCERITVAEVDTTSGNVADRKLLLEMSKYEVVERDQEVLDKIKWGIKHDYPVVGMIPAEAREAMGEPDEIEKAGRVNQWIYRCSDEDGFDYNCYILKFLDGSLVKFDDLE
ncbi:MAG: hypothetical protein AAF462_01560 [Thermodesulfobacteriota bacterium]